MMSNVNDGESIAVWFSCGAASAVAAKLVVDRYGKTNTVHVINNPVKEEDPDNRRFLQDVEAWIGSPIEIAINDKYPDSSCVSVWSKRRFMSGPLGAVCTVELKKRARQNWELLNPVEWHVLGFTSEEKVRFDRFRMTERGNVLGVLLDAGLSKQDCLDEIVAAGIEPPAIYKRGYPNANCIGCVKATSPTYWNHVREYDPVVFLQRAEQSRELGVKLARYRGDRVFLDELPKYARGRPLKSLRFDCGIFCEEEAESEAP
jgi:hypothetical protein